MAEATTTRTRCTHTEKMAALQGFGHLVLKGADTSSHVIIPHPKRDEAKQESLDRMDRDERDRSIFLMWKSLVSSVWSEGITPEVMIGQVRLGCNFGNEHASTDRKGRNHLVKVALRAHAPSLRQVLFDQRLESGQQLPAQPSVCSGNGQRTVYAAGYALVQLRRALDASAVAPDSVEATGLIARIRASVQTLKTACTPDETPPPPPPPTRPPPPGPPPPGPPPTGPPPTGPPPTGPAPTGPATAGPAAGAAAHGPGPAAGATPRPRMPAGTPAPHTTAPGAAATPATPAAHGTLTTLNDEGMQYAERLRAVGRLHAAKGMPYPHGSEILGWVADRLAERLRCPAEGDPSTTDLASWQRKQLSLS